ncbi:MAG TPA: methyltransferase domain-containing protein [Caulobacteraceae bacterium]|nr:methyltransferase domain-containing protein [Caulobacteraceae bacterium]
MGVFVSVGCSDRHYFDWLDKAFRPSERHLALEAYREKPSQLPANVEWIANTAGNMAAVARESADAVFAGQVVEHLWAEELAGFFMEASRVLKPGGLLIVDSPNEKTVHDLGWNHPEHTLEFRPADAVRLFELAGFRVTKAVGHWLCRSADGGLLPLEEIDPAERERRIRDGRKRLDDAFSWWLEGVKEAPADAAAIARFVAELWARYGGRRVQRTMRSQRPLDAAQLINGVPLAAGPRGWTGALVYGPYIPLPPGRTLVGFTLEPYDAKVSPGRIEVFQLMGNQVMASAPLPPRLPERGTIWLEVELDATLFGMEFRLWTNGTAEIRARVGVELARLP